MNRRIFSTISSFIFIHLLFIENRPVEAQKILFISIPSLSHLNGLISIARELETHHPDVEISFAAFDGQASVIQKKLQRARIVSLGPMQNKINQPKFIVDYGEPPLAFMKRISLPGFLSLYEPMHAGLLKANLSNNFDLLVINMFAFAAQDLAHDLNIPFVIHSCTSVEGVFDLPSWIPHGYDRLTQDDLATSFFNRVYNYLVEPLRIIYYLGPRMIELDMLRKRNNRTTQGIHPLFTNPVQRWQGHPILIPFPLAFDFRRSYTPNYHLLGFILDPQDSTEQSIDADEIDEWLDATRPNEEYVVVVAFGSITVLTERTWKSIVTSLDLLPNMRLLLAIHDQESREKVSAMVESFDNHRVMIKSWIPQRHILKHEQVRVFVCHGGLNSVGEAVYAHKPTIIMPGFGDQAANGARMRALNVSFMLHRDTMTAQEFATAVQSLVDRDSYLSIVSRLKVLHYVSEEEGGGARRAARLLVGWARYNYQHLDTLDHHLPFWMAYELDIYAFIISVLYIIVRVLNWCLTHKNNAC